GTPDGHLSGTVGRQRDIAQYHLAYARYRKLPLILRGQKRQIRHFGFQRGGCRTRSSGVEPMTGSAIRPEQVRSFDRANQRRKLRLRALRGRSLPADSGEDNAGERKRQYERRGPLEPSVLHLHCDLLVSSARPGFLAMHDRHAKGFEATPRAPENRLYTRVETHTQSSRPVRYSVMGLTKPRDEGHGCAASELTPAMEWRECPRSACYSCGSAAAEPGTEETHLKIF